MPDLWTNNISNMKNVIPNANLFDSINPLSILSGIGDTALGFMNYFNQIENQQYQRKLQKKMFMREDTSVQRRIADLRKAGLSPTLAAGGAASAGPVVQSNTPQYNKSPISQLSTILNMKQQQAQIEQTQAQTNKIKSETEYNVISLNDRIKQVKLLNSHEAKKQALTEANKKLTEMNVSYTQEKKAVELIRQELMHWQKMHLNYQMDEIELNVLYKETLIQILELDKIGKALDSGVYKSIGVGPEVIKAITNIINMFK